VARTVDRFMNRVVEHCHSVVRVVEESETVRARRMDVKAEELLAIRGENTVVSAEGIVKVDGGQIHFG
jgi:small nuclear ribonucleoprotein (snRNP)-like protein